MTSAETEPPKLGGTNESYPAETSLVNDPNRWVTKGTPNLSAGVRKCKTANQFEANGDPCLDLQGKPTCCDGDPCDPTLEEPQANSKTAKEARNAVITLTPNTVLQANILNKINKQNQDAFAAQQKLEEQQRQEAAELAARYYINECDYFQEIKRDNPFVYASLGEKIQNFHPAFHAITPEGFNSRLTFLQQCMRQGPQLMDSELPQNMVFGRPPICVLKIGDFYHTKIVIDSMNFSYDPLQWDLNPEGIGVQPMVVKVDMGFKFIGGSSLGGPIKQLQNAVSYNFFANTGIYQPAQVLDNKLEGRRKFIYGAFKTPEEATNAYREVQAAGVQTAEDLKKIVPSNPNTTSAPAEILSPEEAEKLNNSTSATSGSNNPPTNGTPTNPSDNIASVNKNDNGVQIIVNDTNWTLYTVEVDSFDTTSGPVVMGSIAYGGSISQDTITNGQVKDFTTETMGSDEKDLSGYPNVNYNYIITVTEKNLFPDGQKKVYNISNTIKLT